MPRILTLLVLLAASTAGAADAPIAPEALEGRIYRAEDLRELQRDELLARFDGGEEGDQVGAVDGPVEASRRAADAPAAVARHRLVVAKLATQGAGRLRAHEVSSVAR